MSADKNDGNDEIIELPDGHLVLIPGDIPEENKAEIRWLAWAAGLEDGHHD